MCYREGSCPPGARASRPQPYSLMGSLRRCTGFFQERAGLQSRASAGPHRIIAGVGFLRNNVPSCLSCASMFMKSVDSPAPLPFDPSGGEGRGCARLWCGRDARAPGGASSHDRVTPGGQNCRSIPGPAVVEGGPSVFMSIRVHSWFVFIDAPLFHSRMIRPVSGGGGGTCLQAKRIPLRQHPGTRRDIVGADGVCQRSRPQSFPAVHNPQPQEPRQ